MRLPSRLSWLRSPDWPEDTDVRQASMLWGLLWSLMILSLPIMLVVDFGGPVFLSLLFSNLLVIVLLVLTRRGHVAFANLAVPSILFALITYINIVSDGTHDIGVVAYMLVITLAALLLGTRALIAFTLLVVAAYTVMALMEMIGWLVSPLAPFTSFVDIVIFAAVCSIFAILLRVTLQYLIDNAEAAAANERAMIERNAQLEASRAEVERLNAELEQRIAARTADLQVAMAENEQLFNISRDMNSAQNHVELVEAIAQHLDNPDYTVTLALYENHDKATARTLSIVAQRFSGQPQAVPIYNDSHRAAPMRDWLAASAVFVVNDLDNPPEPLSDDLIAYLARAQIKAFIIVELVINTRILGFVTIALPHPHTFADHDVRVMRAASDLSAAAVERIRLYSDQVTAAERLRAADEVKNRFMANMSHELRTPLNAILNFTRFVSSGMLGTINAEQLDALNKTITSGKHLLSLINDVLDVTKIESQMLTLFVENNVDLSVEIEAAVLAGEALLADKSVTMVRNIAADLPPIIGDRRRLRQVLLNLISNACKFTETGSVTVSAHRDGEQIVVDVTDTGPGLSPEEHVLIFEPFRQSRRGLMTSGGTGLGLAIARRLVESHEGTLGVTSTPGEGASFTVRLPIASANLAAQVDMPEVYP